MNTEMPTISQQHCFQHADREAVVRCPVCHRFFCRECVTEHDDRMLCNPCLRQWAGTAMAGTGNRLRRLMTPLQGVLGFLILWYVFFLVGQMLLAVPHSFHEGTLWQTGWWRAP